MREKSIDPKPPEESKVSYTITSCQVCGRSELEPLVFLGYLPPVNTMPEIGKPPQEQPAFPTQLLRCQHCELVQLGSIVDASVLFPPSYPYTSGTTKILRENFAELYREVSELYPFGKEDLCVDVGSNDGTLLKNFAAGGHRIRGIEPTNTGKLAIENGIPTHIFFFDRGAVDRVVQEEGKAKILTITNCFAHIDDVNGVVDNVCELLSDEGIFINESHYLASLIQTVQYDTIYHEHMRYYSLTSQKNLLGRHGLEIIHARKIPTHGGSMRVYSAKKGRYPVRESVAQMLEEESEKLKPMKLRGFQATITKTKLDLYSMLAEIKGRDEHIHGIGAPSRASTLINYVGLDHGILDCVLEISGSHKIGKYIPGTRIPVLEESKLFTDQPEYALMLSWHIAEELMPKIKSKNFRGDFIVPLPSPRIVSNDAVGA